MYKVLNKGIIQRFANELFQSAENKVRVEIIIIIISAYDLSTICLILALSYLYLSTHFGVPPSSRPILVLYSSAKDTSVQLRQAPYHQAPFPSCVICSGVFTNLFLLPYHFKLLVAYKFTQ